MVDQMILVVHNPGNALRCYLPPVDLTATVVAEGIERRAKRAGLEVTACVVPVKVACPDDVEEFIEEAMGELRYTVAKEQAGPGTLFPRTAYD